MTTEAEKQSGTPSPTDDAAGWSDFELLAKYLEPDFGNVYEFNMNGGDAGVEIQEWTKEMKDAVRHYLLHELPEDVAPFLFSQYEEIFKEAATKREAVDSFIDDHEPWMVANEVHDAAVKVVSTLDELIGSFDTWPSEEESWDAEIWLEEHVSDADLKEMALWLSPREPTVRALTHDHEPPALVETWKHFFDPGPAPSDLTDDEWELFKPFLPPATKWAPWTEDRLDIARRVLSGMLYRHHNKTTWARIPRRYGSSVQVRYSNYKTSGVFARALTALDGRPGAERLVEWLRTIEGPEASSSHIAA